MGGLAKTNLIRAEKTGSNCLLPCISNFLKKCIRMRRSKYLVAGHDSNPRKQELIWNCSSILIDFYSPLIFLYSSSVIVPEIE